MGLTNMNNEVIHNEQGKKKANLWVFWKKDLGKHKIVGTTNQVITIEIRGILIFGVHAKCTRAERSELWQEL